MLARVTAHADGLGTSSWKSENCATESTSGRLAIFVSQPSLSVFFFLENINISTHFFFRE